MRQKFLHVGCGKQNKLSTPFASDAWSEIRLDINPDVKPDVIGSITDMSLIPDSCMDAIFSSHNIEHLYPHEVPKALGEFKRVLKPSGFALITCPDLKSICKLVAEDKLNDPAYTSPSGHIAPIDIIYGHRKSIEDGEVHMAHRCGFTAKTLAHALSGAGFNAFALTKEKTTNIRDIWALASIQQSQEWLKLESEKLFNRQTNRDQE